MTSPVSSGGTSGTPIRDVLGKSTQPEKTPGNSLGQDAFLKLLVAQLRYQDPTSPSDGAQFLAQTAQFTQVEKLNELAKSQASMLSAQTMLSASNMVGRTVTYTDSEGVTATGKVVSASVNGTNPSVKIGDVNVPLSSITTVHA
ncbi:flagellar basal body rod modification protein FlgD [Pilimelia terevasa]|uniref:Flagellar basal body rod modification protein FlgD n=1 Tax=Pilimelia terevasa TaxID=53372 RepID=A0A8J3FES0_9ACTN|nr:flagellar hook capping FlgD N-terminal domain-containing protein [Pilimelia terevasa]GGK18108.1 flagellar basal body rod modification protein FlgD [Pilimelia terevasa]